MKKILFIPLAIIVILMVANYQKEEPVDEDLGVALPKVVALFEDSLQASISSSATSFTLVRGTDADGNNLSGNYAFIIDEGGSSEEFVTATCAATACTSAKRGISTITGTSTVSALQKSHRRGGSVKATDYPVLGLLRNLLNGEENFPNLLYYDSDVSFSSASTTALTSKDYVDNSVNQGAATSTEAVGGISELATSLEQASSTDEGGDQPLVLQAKNATSTPGSTCYSTLSSSAGALCTVIATLSGKISQLWLDLTAAFTWAGAHIFNSTVTFNDNVTMENATSTASFHATEFCDAEYCRNRLSGIINATTTVITISNSVAVTGIVATTTIPGGLLQTNGVVTVKTYLTNFRTTGDVAGTATLRYGNQTLAQATNSVNAGTATGGWLEASIFAAGATNAQIGHVGFDLSPDGQETTGDFEAAGGGAPGTVDSTTDQDLTITWQWGAADALNRVTASSTIIKLE